MGLKRTQYADVITKSGGYYNFVTMINRRIKELRNDALPMIQPEPGEDLIDLAIREIENGLVTLLPGVSAPPPEPQAPLPGLG